MVTVIDRFRDRPRLRPRRRTESIIQFFASAPLLAHKYQDLGIVCQSNKLKGRGKGFLASQFCDGIPTLLRGPNLGTQFAIVWSLTVLFIDRMEGGKEYKRGNRTIQFRSVIQASHPAPSRLLLVQYSEKILLGNNFSRIVIRHF